MNFEKSAIVKHSHIKDHQIDRQAAQLITPINTWHPRRIREAIEIFKHDTVPQDIGFYISDIWRPLLWTEGSSISKVHTTHPRISYILSHPPFLPLCLLTTDSVQWAQTPPPPPLQGSQSYQFPACTLQRTNPPASSLCAILRQSDLSSSISQIPAFSRWRSEHTWSKRRVVTSRSN